MTVDEVMEECIRSVMTKNFYIEGKNKDYYFGKSPLNDSLTVFFNPNKVRSFNVTKFMSDAFFQVCKDYHEYLSFSGVGTGLNLKDTPFNIDGGVMEYFITDSSGKHPYYLNYLPKDELEEAIKRDPERWNVCQKMLQQDNKN